MLLLREEGLPLNWADDCECDVAWDALSTDVDEEPMFVAPLATASPKVETTSPVKNVEDEAKKQYSVVALGYWKNQAVKKSVALPRRILRNRLDYFYL